MKTVLTGDQIITRQHFRPDPLAELDALLPAILDRAFKGEL
jgi:hypothetical protein